MKKDIIISLINIFCLCCVSTLLLVSCLAGEILQSESLKIFESLCEIPWYEMSPNVRKYLILIIEQSVRPMTIHYKGRAYIHLRTFAQMLNSCYSYFMLLNSMN